MSGQREARLKFFENEEHRQWDNANTNSTTGTGESHEQEGEGKLRDGEEKREVTGQEEPEILDEEEALKRAMELSLLESGNVVPALSSSSATAQKEKVDIAKAEEHTHLQEGTHTDLQGKEEEEEMVPVPVDESLRTQLIDMGFNDIHARKAIVHGKSLEGALEWLSQHENDPDIDQPYLVEKSDAASAGMPRAPMSEEEKAKKIAEMQVRIQQRREEREKQEKTDAIKREKDRRERGQKIEETMEERQKNLRKAENDRLKREKLEIAKERERLRAEIARDKEIRRQNKGVLPSVLGVDGYNPSIIQYDVPADQHHPTTTTATTTATTTTATTSSSLPSSASVPMKRSSEAVKTTSSTTTTSVPAMKTARTATAATAEATSPTLTPEAKVDSAIMTISRYRRGGDGGQALKLLITFLKNIVEHPEDLKYRSINSESAAFKGKLASLIGPMTLLKTIGFEKDETDGKLKYNGTGNDSLLVSTLTKLVNAETVYRQENPSTI